MDDSFLLHIPVEQQPRKRASYLSRLFFCWAPPLFYRSYKKTIKEEYYAPLKSHKSDLLGEKLENVWKTEYTTKENPSLWKALWIVFRLEFITLGFIFILSELILKMSQPWFIGKLMNNDSNFKSNCYIYGSLIVASSFLNVMVGHFYQLKIQHLGMKIRIACCSLMYRHVIKMNKTVVAKCDIGQVINLLSNDVNRFDLAAMYMLQLIVAPIETIFAVCCLYITVGPTSITGIVFLMLFIPTQMFMGKLTTSYRQKTAKKTDRRIQLMNEIISGIQVIKMFVWEKLFTQLVSEARENEIRQILKVSYIRALNVSFMLFMNRTGIFLCILTYVLTTQELDAKYVFVVSSFYAILRQALTVYFPFGIQNFSETRVSVERMRKFLLIGHEKETKTYFANKSQKMEVILDTKFFDHTDKKIESFRLDLENVSVKWLPNSNYILQNVNFRAYDNELAIITGPVGSGKSTLFYTVLKELPISHGAVTINGNVSYASQEPWLFSGTIRQNIIFGSTFDIDKYRKVVQVCQLEEDFSNLSNGDGTLIGESGTLLSGGQKARINLARAVYKDVDIYLLDDPLSAVDVKVGRKIFQECIVGYLKNKCTVLITHNTAVISDSIDRIYNLDKGIITEIIICCKKSEDVEENETDTTTNVLDKYKKQRLEEEERSKRAVSTEVYKMYALSGGNCCRQIFILILFTLAQIFASGADYFVAFWVNLKQENHDIKQLFTSEMCLKIYSCIIVGTIILPIIRSVSFFKYCLRASKNLHDVMFSTVIKTLMTFFKTNPSGRILNRFSKDMGMVDETLPAILMDTCQVTLIVLGSAVLIVILNWWMIIPTIVIFSLFYHFKKIFINRSRNLKRFEATARSPIYSHVNTTIQGLPTIRSCNAQNQLKSEFDHLQDLHSSAFYMFLSCNRAFGFWLDMNCVFYTAAVMLTLTLIETPVGSMGLGITQSMNLIGVLQWGIRQWSELENQMINVERIVEYTKLPTEEYSEEIEAPQISNGQIKFESVYLQYSDHVALKNITFTVKPKEKIGIVGRTGAGKSSLISSLFRLYKIKGNIIIDDVHITDIPLNVLRSKISIIPQEPILFSGTLRDNIDPCHKFNDNELWKVLDQVELKNAITKLSKGLDSEIIAGGSNLSVGERQLICLARAVLENNKILILDEATANIDILTDYAIQNSIKNNFQDCTILTVAHRLSTIMEYDKVLVMDNGKMVEFDQPDNLLRNPDSVFAELVRQSDRGNTNSVDRSVEKL